MRDIYPILLELQKIDLGVHELTAQRVSLPRALAEKKAVLEQKKATLSAKQEETKRAKMDADRREVDLKEAEGKILKMEGQLNTIKTNKEYTILRSEIAAARAEVGLIEDDILRLMSKVEAAQTEVKALQAEVDLSKGELAQSEKQVEAALTELDGKIASLKQSSDATARNLPPDIVAQYRRIQGHKPDGKALVEVKDGFCQGCFMEPNSQDLNLIMGRRQVVNCRTCGRILFIRNG